VTSQLCHFYRQVVAKRQTAGIKFTHRPKNRFFTPQRFFDSLHQFTSNLVGPTGIMPVGPLGCAKFHLNRHGVGMLPKKYQNFPLFGKESPRFRNFFRGFYTPNYATLAFQISCNSHHRLRSYCGETARRSIRPNFSVHPVGKTVLDQKMEGFEKNSTAVV